MNIKSGEILIVDNNRGLLFSASLLLKKLEG